MNITKIMTTKEQESLHATLRERGGIDVERVPPGASYVVRYAETIVTAYRGGKVLFQGKDVEAAAALSEENVEHAVNKTEPTMKFPIAGADESGKGDLFGPLAIAAFVARNAHERNQAVQAGARDCKLMSDVEVQSVAAKLREIGECRVRVLMPEEYNARYASVHNVNVLLNELYGELLQEVAASSKAKTVILDKYGGRALNLWKGTQGFRFVVETHAERYPEVAAASVLARAAFLDGLHRTGAENGVPHLPKGASSTTQRFMRQLASEKGKDLLGLIAKVNFAPVKEVLEGLF